MDITISFALGVISLVLYPFVALAIKLGDGGPVFIVQERIGQGNRIMKLYKFRSMMKMIPASGFPITKKTRLLKWVII